MTLKERTQRLLPNGYPRYVRVYDMGPDKMADRYTVVFTGRYNNRVDRKLRAYLHLGMSENPFSPQGFCQVNDTQKIIDVDEKEQRWAPEYGKSNHLGKRIHWHELPEDCRKISLHCYKEIWNLYAKTKGRTELVAGIASGVQVVRTNLRRSPD